VDEVEAYQRQLLRALRAAADAGVSAGEVERVRRLLLGRHLRAFNAPEGWAHWLLGLALEGVPSGAAVEVVRAAAARGLTRHLRELVGAPRAWSVLLPRAGR
jgi:hypothetical protein